MKAIIALVVAGFLCSEAAAQTVYLSPVTCQPLGRAPDMMSGGYYVIGCNGQCYGPNYYVYPPFEPWQGFRPVFQQQQHSWHNYARSPRDFFMWSDMLEERIARERRPALVP